MLKVFGKSFLLKLKKYTIIYEFTVRGLLLTDNKIKLCIMINYKCVILLKEIFTPGNVKC